MRQLKILSMTIMANTYGGLLCARPHAEVLPHIVSINHLDSVKEELLLGPFCRQGNV